MSIEMKITGANPAEIAQQITAMYGLFALPKAYTGPALTAAEVGGPGPIIPAGPQNAAPETTTNVTAEPVAESPKPRGRPKKNPDPAPTIEIKANEAPEPEKQVDIEEAIAEVEAKEVDEATVRAAIIKLANVGKAKAAPDIQEVPRKIVGGAYQALDDAGVARGLPKLAEFKLAAVPADRRAEFLALIEAKTAELNALADGAWKG